ncbi:MAG: YfiR family protein [Kangiellaceae bacterium]|nr:YfiR family protein [Kangiellaceae bacterium]MCW9016660.1 YfiR family protein [Kangiellaceae bacterium]
MIRVVFLVFCLVGLSNLGYSADRADEQVMRPVILQRLLSQINWYQGFLEQNNTFQLCVYKDFAINRGFSKYLKGLTVSQLPIKVRTINERKAVDSCHAVFLSKPSATEAAWFFNPSNVQKTLIIAEGKGLARKGAHISLYIGKDEFFDFELNLDSFVGSGHIPGASLIELGKVASSPLVQKANLMRSLIGYTDWPEAGPQKEQFNLCTFQTGIFTDFADFILNKKSVKGMSARILQIRSIEQLNQCNGLILQNEDLQILNQIIYQRKSLGILLIGNAKGLGEKGVHYNLIPEENKQNRRFELNLLAMELSGLKPHHQLLSSAQVIKKDFPAFTKLLFDAVNYTDWPNGNDVSQEEKVTLCLYRREIDFQNVEFFLSAIKQGGKKIELELISDQGETGGCNALLLPEIELNGLSEFVAKNKAVLFITSQQNASAVGVQYNLKVAPKQITLELFESNIRKAGFKPQKILQDLGVIIGGQL